VCVLKFSINTRISENLFFHE